MTGLLIGISRLFSLYFCPTDNNKKIKKQNQLKDKVVMLRVVCGVLLKKGGMTEKESFPMKSHLADIVHCKAATFPPLI